MRTQYLYYAERFGGSAVFMEVGRFYEFYSSASAVPQMLSLKPLGPNRRGATYGFRVASGSRYAKRVVEAGLPVVFVRQTGRYFGKIQQRLPQVKVTAA